MKSLFRNLEGITILIFLYSKVIDEIISTVMHQDRITLNSWAQNSELFPRRECAFSVNVSILRFGRVTTRVSWSRDHVVSKSNIAISEQVLDKKITGMNGSHFLYLYDDLIENDHFSKIEIQNSKNLKIPKFVQGSIFDSRKLKLRKKILPGDSWLSRGFMIFWNF